MRRRKQYKLTNTRNCIHTNSETHSHSKTKIYAHTYTDILAPDPRKIVEGYEYSTPDWIRAVLRLLEGQAPFSAGVNDLFHQCI